MEPQKITWYAKKLIRTLLKFYYERQAKLSHKVFTCDVLKGVSTYNLAINSDMTVSCNCQDFDGAGELGDFSQNSLEEILAGKQAQSFRKLLSAGKLPILNCTRCTELKMVSQHEAKQGMDSWRVPDQNIMVENTVLCGCSCLSCARSEVMKLRKKNSLSLSDINKIALEVNKHKIKSISYFKLGDPFMSPNIFQELSIIREINPNILITTSTNGLYLDTDEKFEAALLLDRVHVSIDGINTKMLKKYQRNSTFERAFGNMCKIINRRNSKGQKKPKIVWNYILFNWNDKPEHIKTAINLAKEHGVDEILLYHTKTPFWGTSWRWYTNKFYRDLGRSLSSQTLTIPFKPFEHKS